MASLLLDPDTTTDNWLGRAYWSTNVAAPRESEAGLRGRVQARRECQGQPKKKGRVGGGRVTIPGHTLSYGEPHPPLNPGALLENTGPVSHCFLTKQGRQRLSAAPQRHGDASILDDSDGLVTVRGIKFASRDFTNITQVLSATRHKVAEAHKRFQRFVLSDGVPLEPRLDERRMG